MHRCVFHHERPRSFHAFHGSVSKREPRRGGRRAGSAGVLTLIAGLSVGPRAEATGEIQATAALAVARDPSGQKAAATAGALLRQRVVAAEGLRLVRPGPVLTGDPQTQVEETLERARSALADGRRSYDALELGDATARLEQAVALFRRAGPALRDISELSTALAYLGGSRVLQGSTDAGRRRFVELLTITPNYQPSDFPPAVQRIFDQALERVDRAPEGAVEIYSTPPYAAVFIDGRFEGVTPLVRDGIVAGTHHLRLEKLGYRVHGASITVVKGQRTTDQTRLRAFPRSAELRDLARRGVKEIERPEMGGALRRLSVTLAADRLIVIAVSQSGRDATFSAGVFDGASRTRIATRQTVLAVDRPDYHRDLGRYLDRVIAAARRSPADQAPASGPVQPYARASQPPRSAPDQPGLSEQTSGAPLRASRDTPVAKIVGWSLVGLGGATIIAGGVFGVLAFDAHDEFRNTDQDSPDLNDRRDTGKQHALVADVLYGVGGAILLGGITTLLIDEFRDPTASEVFEVEQAELTPTDGGALVSIGGRF